VGYPVDSPTMAEFVREARRRNSAGSEPLAASMSSRD
jgi:hypothetical protein